MDRPDAVVYLNQRFETIMDALSMKPTDDARGLGGSIDGALRDLGLATTAEVVATLDRKFTVLLRVNFLRHALERAAVMVDIQADEPVVQKRRSQMFTQIETALKHAEEEAASALAGADDTDMVLTRMNLDWIQDVPQDMLS